MANFMVLNPKCLNLSDMGTMKTLATLWAADALMNQNPGWKCLIVCPISIFQRTWGDAITANFLGRRTYKIIHGTEKQRRKLLAEPADFYIINYEGTCVGSRITTNKRGYRVLELGGLGRDIADRSDIAIVAIDEASAYRAHNTRRHRVARAALLQKPYFWLLSGTPISNGPLDAYGLARLVNNANGESFTAYRDRVMFKIPESLWKRVPKRGAYEEAYKLLSPSIRYEMRDCTDVPECTEQQRDVEFSEDQRKRYAELKRNLVLDLGNGKVITAAHEAALRLKLIQISAGCIYDHDHAVTRIDCAPRLAVLREAIEEAKRKVIVFAPLTSVIHMLYEELTEYSRAMVNGEVPLEVRSEIFRRFQSEADPQLIIADPATMSHGLDLYAASVIVWYAPTDRSELYLQANRRIDRPGQVVPTTIVQLAATPIEREIYRRIASNTSMQGLVLDMVKRELRLAA
jgi:SNF2 family DNA or RNA helicase